MAKKNAKSGNSGNSGNNGKAVGQDQAGREIDGSNRSDILIGSRRDDVINGRGGSDLIIGGNGNDQISGGGGSDLLLGGNGDDVINGGRGSDTLIGGRGDDILNGGAGNDLLIGGAGNDVFNGGAGNDTIIGGAGENTVILSGSVRDYSVEMGRRSVTVSGEDGTDTLSGIEVLSFDDATVYLDGRNNGPLLDSDVSVGIEENGAATINALVHAFDFDGDTLTLVSVDAGEFAGMMSFDPTTGEITLDPGAAYDNLAEGEVVTFTLSYTVSDGTDTGTGEMTVQITGSNDAPIVTPIDAGPVSEDGGLLSVDLMATASDVDSGDTIGIEEIQSVTSSNPDRSIVWGLDPNNYDAVQLDLNQFTDLQEGETETVTISYVVGDNRGGLTTNTATFTVVGTNDLPTYVDFTTSVSEDSPLWVNLLASVEDVDSDTVVATDVVAFSSNPDRPITANVDLAAGTVIFPSGQFEDLAEGQTETLTITFNLDDGDGGIVPRQLSFTVIGSNDAPYIEPWNSSLEATLDENDAPTLVTAGTVAFEDVDNGDWQQGGFTGLTLSGNAGDLNPNNLYGLLRLDDFAQDGSLGWVFTADSGLFDYLQEGESVTLTYDVEITDGRASDTTQVSITIEGTNDLPTFVDFTISLGESEPLWVNLLASVEDVDSDTVVVTDVVAFTDNPDRVVTANVNLEEGTVTVPYGQYEDLAEGETEILTIQFNLDDGDGGIVARELQFTVIGQNDAPYFEPWNSDLEADAEAAGDGQLSASGVIGISDPDASDTHTGSTLGVALSGDVGDLTEADVIGLLSFAASGDGPSVAWSFDAESALFSQLTGSLTLTYEVEISDGHDSVTAPVTITITPQNAAPGAPDFDVSMSEDSFFVYVDLLEGASDADGDNLSVVNVVMETSNPNRSFVYNLDESSGQFTIYPGNFQDLSAGETETITLTYDVEDGQGGVTPRTVTITVDGANDAVTIYDNANLMFGENDAAVLSESGTWSYSDVDANDTYTATVGPIDVRGNGAGLAGVDLASLLTLDAVDGVLSWSFDADASVFDYLDDGDLVMVNFIIELSDGASTSTTQISLMVTGADDLPSVSATLEATTSEDDAPLSLDLLTHALDPEGDSMAVTGVTATTASGAAVAFTVDALTGELVIDPAQFGGLAAGETETITVNYGVANADTVITGGSDSIPTIGNAGRWFVVNFDTGQVVEEARSSGNSAAPYAEPANGVVFHFNGNNADYGISASVYVDGVATVIPPEEFDIEGYFGSLTNTGQWISFANSISNATISWTGTVETPDGAHEVSVSFDGLNFVDNQVGNSTLDSWSVEVSGPTADAIALIEVEGRDEGASMMAKVFSKTEAIDPVKTPVADDVADSDADDGFLQLSHDDGLAVMTAGDVAEFSFDRVFDLTNFRGAAQFASLTETGDAGMELASVRSTPGQAEAFDLPGLDAFGLPQDEAALALPVPDMPEGW
jgi:VCBS repeat-containing protein